MKSEHEFEISVPLPLNHLSTLILIDNLEDAKVVPFAVDFVRNQMPLKTKKEIRQFLGQYTIDEVKSSLTISILANAFKEESSSDSILVTFKSTAMRPIKATFTHNVGEKSK